MPKEPYQLHIRVLNKSITLAHAIERIQALPSILWAREGVLKGLPVVTAMATDEATKKGTKREITHEFQGGVVINEVFQCEPISSSHARRR